MWECSTTTNPVARKDYYCQACGFIRDSGWTEGDFGEEEWALIEKAKADGWKILKGQKYLKVSGIWDGDPSVFRARPEIDKLVQSLGWYDDL